ncbi:hypothetical protein MHOL44478_20970 [Mycobacterium holsaticum DSM 44478]|nr:hypothetical protein [Mycolicibacterium holsaticum]MDA4109711.1 hypothetical protein [Mycolicibacterium holsaticum DSM 44478 = JCM 12374]
MTVFDRGKITAVVGAGLCGVAVALSPTALAVPFKTGGADCVETSAGQAPAPAAAGVCLPLTDMAGVPMALPGPVPVAPPVIPPPLVPPVVPPPLVPPPVVPPPVVPPLAPPIAAAGAPIAPLAPVAPITEMAGAGGKGVVTGPAPAGAPVPGQPLAPGPTG